MLAPTYDEPEDVISFHADEEDEMLLFSEESEDEQEKSSLHTPSNTNSYPAEADKASTTKVVNDIEDTQTADHEPRSPTKDERKEEKPNTEPSEEDSGVKRSSSHDSNHSHKRSRTASPALRPWTKAYTSKGELYFYNPETNESRWTFPTDQDRKDIKREAPRDYDRRPVRDQERKHSGDRTSDFPRNPPRKDEKANSRDDRYAYNQPERRQDAYNQSERRQDAYNQPERRQDVYRSTQPPSLAYTERSTDRPYHQRAPRQPPRQYSPDRRLPDREYSRSSNRMPEAQQLPRSMYNPRESRGRPDFDEHRESYLHPSVRRDFYGRPQYPRMDRPDTARHNEPQSWRYGSRVERDRRR
ncbi:hypothetical protein K493DRAFT_61159 [Basidiobolus meristosporus CBS 931.73]|uniref:WW domain-containing protein n=1 Tax=Basidiobolus meristosporus CBS 931.73 TaxID=1314790 RepID=A0A1Y1XWS5_9FUNG|nr:hypothetical protein K493DRAFT_61159 [Basidiobolus meristosporus CBS 931.73]|eukprot:ORX90209.1 hypothetical protein K493DRAFT_61159 [Basidiobolus meristosporus CBS 931.73]